MSIAVSSTKSSLRPCLTKVQPCQSLFVAPCSHVWHYKCIRPILNGPTWPNFLCPNCRAVADLEADVEDLGDFEEWDDEVMQALEAEQNGKSSQEDRQATPRASGVPSTVVNGLGSTTQPNGQSSLSDLEVAITNISIGDSINGIASDTYPVLETPQRFISPAQSSSVTQPVNINITDNGDAGLSPLFPDAASGLSPERPQDCPMTPRNDAGPFVLDGSAGRGSSRGREDDTAGSEVRPIVVE